MTRPDLAGVEHWNQIYQRAVAPTQEWFPISYDSRALDHALCRELYESSAKTVLEVGCGNSTWLPYLARTLGVQVAGMDYSPRGVELAEQRLAAAKISGHVFCANLFEADPEQVGQYDFVFSLGLVEHFPDTAGVLRALLQFVRPCGTLFTEIPNLRSIHGLLSWIWQPALLRKHNLLRRDQLVTATQQAGLQQRRAYFCGVFSPNIVAWELYPRWPKLAQRTTPFIRGCAHNVDRLLRRLPYYGGVSAFAPYIVVTGRKPMEA